MHVDLGAESETKIPRTECCNNRKKNCVPERYSGSVNNNLLMRRTPFTLTSNPRCRKKGATEVQTHRLSLLVEPDVWTGRESTHIRRRPNRSPSPPGTRKPKDRSRPATTTAVRVARRERTESTTYRRTSDTRRGLTAGTVTRGRLGCRRRN